MLQTVLIPREWGLRKARAWIRLHIYKETYYGKDVDITKHYYRFRQGPPLRGSYYTVKLPDGVDLVFVR